MSLTYIGIIVSLLAGLSKILGITVSSSELTTTVQTIVLFVGAIIAFYGRYRRGGINVVGMRK